MSPLSDDALKQLFLDARTFNFFEDRPVPDAVLQQLYETCRWGPTAVNMTPMRVTFVKSAEAKAKLKPTLSAGNADKTMLAPVTAIVATDVDFHRAAKQLFPARELEPKFAADSVESREKFAQLSGTLQCGYFIIAARALGLDCGPMGGFDNAKVDAAFFGGTAWKSILLVNLGYGDRTRLHPRNPRLEFAQACRIE